MHHINLFFALLLAMALTACNSEKAIDSEVGTELSSQSSVTLQENYAGFCHLDGKVENEYAGYTASGYANTEDSEKSKITWKIMVNKSGPYTLTWTYAALAAGSDGAVTVDQGERKAVDLPATGAADSWQTASVVLPLEAGVNTITLAATTSNGLPNIDSLKVSGDAVTAANCDGSPVAEYHPNSRCVAGATFTNEVVDCGGARVGLSCKGGESQPPVITLENATVKSLRIAADGGSDGIWCTQGDCTLENIIWEDICEDAATQKSTPGSTMTVIGGWAWNNGGGKIFQHNARETTVVVTGGFTAKGTSAKLLRACGNCVDNGGPKRLIIDGVRVEGHLKEEVVAPNGNYGDLAVVRNLSIKDYSAGKPPVCVEWVGRDKSEGLPSKSLGERWNTETCDLDPSDVTSF